MTVPRKLIWLFLFGIAFGLVEAAVVIYLRAQYYPEGFALPLKMVPENVLRLEVFREAATLIILAGVGILAGRTRLARFGAFLMTFGAWDIFYYVWLKVFINWPSSFLEQDVLFLIPAPWIGPVLAPLLVSVSMIVCGSWMIWREERGNSLRVTLFDWAVETAAAVVIIASFLSEGRQSKMTSFPWWLFLLGLAGGVIYFIWRAVERGQLSDE